VTFTLNKRQQNQLDTTHSSGPGEKGRMKEFFPRTIIYGLFVLHSNPLVQNDVDAFTFSSSIPSRSLLPSVPRLQYSRCRILQAEKPWNGEDEYVGKDFHDDPKFSQDDDDNSLDKIDETRRLIEAQQKQIDMLMQLVQPKVRSRQQSSTYDEEEEGSEIDSSTYNLPPNSFSSPSPNPVFASTLAPLKTMLFIDGTWLYYSIYDRKGERDIISQRFGLGWQYKYFVDWQRLPRIICEALQEQDQGWSSHSIEGKHRASGRPIEVVRALVFTSYKADTPKTSFRYQMYQDMINANYDVHMMETVGKSEKCIDIQLAVEMLHFATVTNAYDIAVLLSGDKDFMPAMVRTRQKGRKVAVVSMRTGCNRALTESPNIKDYDPVWIEDYLDDLIQRRDSKTGFSERKSPIAPFTFMKVVFDFISKSGLKRVASRDIGRYLKDLKVGELSLLEDLKLCYGGIYQFVMITARMFTCETPDPSEASDHSFWVGLRDDATATLMEEAKTIHFSQAEKDFFDNYSLAEMHDHNAWYWHSLPTSNGVPPWSQNVQTVMDARKETPPLGSGKGSEVVIPEELACDYTTWKVPELKGRCRERGLPVTGKKAELVERIQKDVEREIANLKATRQQKPRAPASKAAETYLLGLVDEYVHARGGRASSRDIGRYLSTNKASENRLEDSSKRVSALQELKEIYGSLKYFASNFDSFEIEDSDGPSLEYHICRTQALRVV
jgi:uncharacterized LabA/DUF88 family protein